MYGSPEDKAYRKTYMKSYNARPEQKDRHKEYLNKVREEKRALVKRLKEEKGCLKCPERDITLLDFHHRDPATKKYRINRMVAQRNTMAALLVEIAKCDILCKNCHKEEH